MYRIVHQPDISCISSPSVKCCRTTICSTAASASISRLEQYARHTRCQREAGGTERSDERPGRVLPPLRPLLGEEQGARPAAHGAGDWHKRALALALALLWLARRDLQNVAVDVVLTSLVVLDRHLR